MKRAGHPPSIDAAESRLALPDWVSVVFSLVLVGGTALAILGATYWLVTHL